MFSKAIRYRGADAMAVNDQELMCWHTYYTC